MPLQRRLPKLKGFKNRNKIVYAVVNVERLAEFDAGSVVTPDVLRDRGLAKKRGQIKILGEGRNRSRLDGACPLIQPWCCREDQSCRWFGGGREVAARPS